MDIRINDAEKIIEIWLTRADQENLVTGTPLPVPDPRYGKYTVAVFQSGQRDLFGMTRDLLLQNRIPKP